MTDKTQSWKKERRLESIAGALCLGLGIWWLGEALTALMWVTKNDRSWILLSPYQGSAILGSLFVVGGILFLLNRKTSVIVFSLISTISLARWLSNWRYVFPMGEVDRGRDTQPFILWLWSNGQLLLALISIVLLMLSFRLWRRGVNTQNMPGH